MGEVVVSSCGGEGMETEKNREQAEKKEGSAEVVRWENFLERGMVLRVLLVEADDSTRQIISALLRKCSFKVVAVPDGLMAWETLKGKPHNIDLILTEVELPLISGYALLTLVMEHDICKNIPVIMMSSHDSISTVLRCMLKGAADFLIKPVRRNELRNLWQHVWRRQNLTAGHIPPNSPHEQRKDADASESNSTSDHSSDCGTSSHKKKECGDEESDAQASQLKYRSSSNMSDMEKEKHEECVTLDKRSAIPDGQTERPAILGSVDVTGDEAYNPTALQLGEEHASTEITIQGENAKPEIDRRTANSLQVHVDGCTGSSGGAINLIGTFDNCPKRTYGNMNINDSTKRFEFPSRLELSLSRYFPNSSKNQGVEEKHVLNHSNSSAFSRYSKMLQPLFPTSTGNCMELKEDVSKYPELSANQPPQNIYDVPQKHGANLNGRQEIMTTLAIGQSGQTEVAYQNLQKLIPVSQARLDNTSNECRHVFSPLYHAQAQSGSPSWSAKVASQQEQFTFPDGTSIHSNSEIQDSERDNRQTVETGTDAVDQYMHQQNKMELVEELKHGSPTNGQSSSSSMCDTIADYNNSAVYGSFSSRNDGNVNCVAPYSKAAVQEDSNCKGISICEEFKGMDSNRYSQREAALAKFRLKRKDRCYEKKVRYQSRKRLAELRPRVKGQFVRQVHNDVPVNDSNDRL